MSTTLGAVRLGAYSMAVSNIFGSNATDVALLAVADAAYREGPLLDAAQSSASFAAAAGIVVTGVYLAGLVERSNTTIWRIGVDSMIVLVLHVSTVAVLYTLR